MKKFVYVATLLVSTAFVNNINAYALDGTVIGHECNRIEEYNTKNNLDDSLYLLNKNAESGKDLLNFTGGYLVGNKYLTNNGDKLSVNPDNTIAINGIKDGLVYDANGNMLNTINIIFAKYKEQWINNCEYMYFDNKYDANTFLIYINLVYGLNQDEFNNIAYVSGKYRISKESINKLVGHSLEDDKVFDNEIQRLYDEVQKSMSISYFEGSDKANMECLALIGILNRDYVYNMDYRYKSMSDSINDKSGVCYHYAKLAQAVLNKLGYNSVFWVGNISEDNHVWLEVEIPNISNTSTHKIMLDPIYSGVLSPYGYLDKYKFRKIK